MKEETMKTKDVEINEDVSFCDMMLSEHVLAGLTKCKFEKPSPIQLRAIPIGRCGLDLIIQSKSGTGKTLVFCTIILERYNPEIKTPQSLIVVPTREIALQVESYLNAIGATCKGFNVVSVIGGRDILEDRKRISKCKAIVGTPGRILHLIKNNYVCMKNIQTFVLDEADKLVTDDFYSDINVVLNALNKDRQIVASSATYANDLDKLIVSFMHNPIAVSTSRDSPILIGVKQFILPVESFSIPSSVQSSTPSIQAMWRKVSAVEYILSTISFKQCILFSNSQFRANSFANYLTQKNWTVELVLGSHDQETRTRTLQKIRQYKSRILVTSDLMARGVDIVNVNLVINLDVPSDSSTYLHRIGRCGRFGRRGLAVTLASGEGELQKFRTMLASIGGNDIPISKFPVNLNGDTKIDVWNTKEDPDTDIFNPADGEASKENGVEQTHEEKSEKFSVVEQQKLDNENEMDSVEKRNLNLLEIAKLLIDTNSSKQQAVHVDEDLFADFQISSHTNDAQPEVTISLDIFEEFAKSQSNAAAADETSKDFDVEKGENVSNESRISEGETRNENEKEVNEEKEKLINGEGTSKEPNLEWTECSFTNTMNAKSQATTVLYAKENESAESSNNARARPSCTNPTKHQTSRAAVIELPQANAFWMQTFWKQLNDINQYVNSVHHRNKRKFHSNK